MTKTIILHGIGKRIITQWNTGADAVFWAFMAQIYLIQSILSPNYSV